MIRKPGPPPHLGNGDDPAHPPESEEVIQELQELWSAHGEEIFRRCRIWMSGQLDEAEEAFSRAGVLALEKYPHHRDELLEPKAWLIRLTYHVCMDLHREQSRERARHAQESEGRRAPGPAWSEDFATPEQALLRREMAEVVRASVRSLPDRLREVAEPLLFEEASYGEIADRLAITGVALRKRVQQAREILRHRLAAYAAGRGPTITRDSQPGESSMTHDASPSPKPLGLDSPGPWSCPRPRALEAVRLRLPSGVERDLLLWTAEEPQRPTERLLARLTSYIRRHPTGWKKRLELARLLRRMGRFEEAVEHYRFVTGRQPRRPAAWVELGAVLAALDRREEAGRLYREGRVAVGRAASRRHLEGLLAGLEGRVDEAVAALRDAARREPDNLAHLLALARLGLDHGRVVEAVEALEAVLAVDPDDPVALTLSHDALRELGRLGEAGRRIARAVERAPESVPALQRLVDLRSRGRRVTAEEEPLTLELLRRLRRRAPRLAATFRARARFHLARGEWDAAEALLAGYLEAHPGHAQGWHDYGRLLEQVGKAGAAAGALRRAFELDPGDRETRCALVALLSRSGSVEAARELLDETLARFPRDAGVVRLAADELSRPPAAVERVRQLLGRAAELQPRLPATAFCRGTVLARWGETRGAVEAFEEGWSLLPADDGFPAATAAALALGEGWQRLGQGERSRAWYRTALSHADTLLGVDPAAAQAARGRALEALGEEAAARAAWRRALELHLPFPERARVASRLRRLDRQAGGEAGEVSE